MQSIGWIVEQFGDHLLIEGIFQHTKAYENGKV